MNHLIASLLLLTSAVGSAAQLPPRAPAAVPDLRKQSRQNQEAT